MVKRGDGEGGRPFRRLLPRAVKQTNDILGIMQPGALCDDFLPGSLAKLRAYCHILNEVMQTFRQSTTILWPKQDAIVLMGENIANIVHIWRHNSFSHPHIFEDLHGRSIKRCPWAHCDVHRRHERPYPLMRLTSSDGHMTAPDLWRLIALRVRPGLVHRPRSGDGDLSVPASRPQRPVATNPRHATDGEYHRTPGQFCRPGHTAVG